MNEQHVVYLFNGIMLSNKTGKKFQSCPNIDGLQKHYTELKQPLFCNTLKWIIIYKNLESLFQVHHYMLYTKANKML